MFLGNKGGSANPFVQISLLDQTKRTTIKKKTLSPIWDEQFFFHYPNLNRAQLDEASLVISLMDYNGPVRSETVLGTYELDLTSVYFSPNHEMRMVTICLDDPEDKVEGVCVRLSPSFASG